MLFQGLIGIVFFILLAFIFSENRNKIDWKTVIWGITLQFIIAGIILGNFFLSLSLFYLFIYAIVTYNIHVILKTKRIIEFLLGFSVTIIGTWLFTVLIPVKDAQLTRNILWNSFLIIGSISVISRNKLTKFLPKYWSNIFGIMLCLAVYGTLFATKTTGSDFISSISTSILKFMNFAKQGGNFLYGDLFDGKLGWIFAIKVSTFIIFFAALMSILDSLGLLNQLISSVSRFINWTMLSLGLKSLSGVECVASVSSIPMGVNIIFIIKNYLEKLTNSEIILILSGIMATISSNLFVVYVSMGISSQHLLAASAMSVPAVIVLSKILVPETENPITHAGNMTMLKNKDYGKPFSAMISGINEGIQASLFLCGALIVFISIISLFDDVLLNLDRFIDGQLLSSIFKGEKNSFGEYKGIIPASMQTFFGYIFSPLAFFIGIPLQDVMKVGYLMGTKFIMNEAVAFTQFVELIKNNELLQVSRTITSFALCGFSNPGTLAIVLGAVSPYVKENRQNFIRYGVISIFVGACASWMTASVASLFTK